MSHKPPLAIYLDQLHWIHLAQARTGHKNGQEYAAIYQYLLDRGKAGAITCPLSLTHYMELSGTRSYRQRTDVATVMAELSGFRTISSLDVLRRAELEQALNKHFGRPATPAEVKPFGFGVSFAASGENKALRFKNSDGTPFTSFMVFGGAERARRLEHTFTALMEFGVLRGPHESQLQELRDKYGYAPEKAEEVARKRAEREEELAQQFIADPSLKKKLDHIVTARYLYWELLDPLLLTLAEIGMTMQDFLAIGREGVTQFVHDVPTAYVLTAFTKANLKNLNRAWQKNDIHDMDALAVAIPYCDIVVTEKHAFAQLRNAGVESKYNTKLLRKISELPGAISSML